MDEEQALAWQDVFDEIAAGRKENLSCPFCAHTPLEVIEQGRKTRIECGSCRKYVEGVFGGY